MKRMNRFLLLLLLMLLGVFLLIACDDVNLTTTANTTSTPTVTTTTPQITTPTPVATKPIVTTTLQVTTTTKPVTTATPPKEEPPHGHDWSLWEIEIEPTCTQPGKEIRYCNCGLTERQAVRAKGHTEGEWITTKQPTCTETGSKYLSCTDCTAALETQTIPKTGHQMEWILTIPSTPDTRGTEELKCKKCSVVVDTRKEKTLGEALMELGYKIVCPSSSSYVEIDAVRVIERTINELSGKTINVTDDYVKRGQEIPSGNLEILIGETNRASSKAAVKDVNNNLENPQHRWQIIIKYYEVVIVAATDEGLMAAANAFVEMLSQGSSLYIGGYDSGIQEYA